MAIVRPGIVLWSVYIFAADMACGADITHGGHSYAMESAYSEAYARVSHQYPQDGYDTGSHLCFDADAPFYRGCVFCSL